MTFSLADLDYELPAGRIAQEPLARRDEARLLVVRRGRPEVRHATVRDLPGLLPPRTLVVVNDTRVFPARLAGRRESTGGACEFLLVRRLERRGERIERWTALLGTRGKPGPGEQFDLGVLRATLVERPERGTFVVDLEPREAGDTVERALERGGATPLPPYIRRAPDPSDRERYQTVYAARPGAVAAPTAGLHFTPELLARLEGEGHELVRITLHVGPGTFRPITADAPEKHVLDAEWAEVSDGAAATISAARREGRVVLAVGTTVVRTLESAAGGDFHRPNRALQGAAAASGQPRAEARGSDPGGRQPDVPLGTENSPLRPFAGDTALMILPGHRFRAVDALLTNFHLPRTTLLALVMALHGVEETKAAYAEAIREGYRFYSYGDAMIVLEEAGR
ncbi:MAG: S-adenosylmethionine:tRNA ribosyltransferase-isomerase [Deltaproteobacteria bacterium]|nr:S-adenosylmethionine:tRNA ribosyltransferase-isomerase [Deltaproteobacteria bacterium]